MKTMKVLVSLLLLGSSVASHVAQQFDSLPEDQALWGRMLFSMSMMSTGNGRGLTLSPTVDIGEAFCGNGVLEEGEECDGENGIGETPFQCGPYAFCNNDCKCEFPHKACIDRTGAVHHGHQCHGFVEDGTHTCCTGQDDGQDLCHECGGCQTNVAITPHCCADSECGNDDICCPIDVFGQRTSICLDSSHGKLGDPCSPDECSLVDIASGVEECLNCSKCLDSTCGGGSLSECHECRNACFRGSKNGPVLTRTNALRGASSR